MATRSLGERIREARERAGYTQPELAGLVGVAPRTIGNWERGEVATPRNSLTRLMDVLPELREDAGTVHQLRPVPAADDEASPLVEAIKSDTTLLPEAREHLLNQYQLLLRIQGPQQERLPYVAHGERTTPVDEAQEVALEEAAKAAAKANPRSPKRTK